MKVKILTPISHDNVYYDRGDVVELPDQAVEALMLGDQPSVTDKLDAPLPMPEDENQVGSEPPLKDPEDTGGKGAFNRIKKALSNDAENPTDTQPEVKTEDSNPDTQEAPGKPQE